MRKKLLTRTALAATIALGIGSFNLAYAAETEDTSSGKRRMKKKMQPETEAINKKIFRVARKNT